MSETVKPVRVDAMAMNFFESQEQARKNTGRLVILFALAVIGIIVAVYLVIVLSLSIAGPALKLDESGQLRGIGIWNPTLLVTVGGFTILLIGLGCLFKMHQLRSGGSYIAESLGGRRLHTDTTDALERRVLNVVEEMAIASGIPAPPVYLMEKETGINAFAAGFSPHDAVIGVTRGCVEQLSRDELQGVIAHEFSHILNGDMKLSIRLIGILSGILVIGMIGYFILRSAFYSGMYGRRSSRDRGNPIPFLLIGVGLIVVGYIGTFFGNWIKAAVSRQREYLADASAVQFTRNPDGIGGALQKIGGFATGSKIQSPNAPQASHMFFGQALSGGLNFMFATHPPLSDRISRIDPGWDGKFVKTEAKRSTPLESSSSTDRAKSALDKFGAIATLPVAAVAIEQIGQISQEHLDHAKHIIETLPEGLVEAAHETFCARAVIYGLLLNRDEHARIKQLTRLRDHGEAGIHQETTKLAPAIEKLASEQRLPLIDMTMPALRELTPSQYGSFRENVEELVKADSKISLFEWSIQRIVLRHLDEQFQLAKRARVRYYALGRLGKQCEILLSMLAYAGHQDSDSARHAFDVAKKHLGLDSLSMISADQCRLEALDSALDELAAVSPKLKHQLLLACAACIGADQEITSEEAELFRAFGESLDVPVPPILPGQPLG
ncbi:MAG: M48 family metallopeptidase [Planctomycetes bacterium]|nr:M48 family metallopeptidase [Planctomycetota bacterium]